MDDTIARMGRATVMFTLVLSVMGTIACDMPGMAGVDPTDPPTDPPPKPRGGGEFAISGINRIPTDLLKIRNEQMQSMFVTIEKQVLWHGKRVRNIACKSYVAPCNDPESYTGKTRTRDGKITVHRGDIAPYSSFASESDPLLIDSMEWVYGEVEKMGTAKIVVSAGNPSGTQANLFGADIPFLDVSSMGNTCDPNNPGCADGGPRYGTDVFAPAINPLTGELLAGRVPEAIKAEKALLIAGWDRDASGDYVRHSNAIACGPYDPPVDNGCLWARFSFPSGSGTSFSSPNVGAALASVLAVFPDTTHQDLSRLAKACAKKTGEGIEELLREWGGIGVADFGCMGAITDALQKLPSGGVTHVAVDGRTVVVSERSLTVR